MTPLRNVPLKLDIEMYAEGYSNTVFPHANVKAEISMDGKPFKKSHNSVFESRIPGSYSLVLTSREMNAESVTVKFKAPGCANSVMTVVSEDSDRAKLYKKLLDTRHARYPKKAFLAATMTARLKGMPVETINDVIADIQAQVEEQIKSNAKYARS